MLNDQHNCYLHISCFKIIKILNWQNTSQLIVRAINYLQLWNRNSCLGMTNGTANQLDRNIITCNLGRISNQWEEVSLTWLFTISKTSKYWWLTKDWGNSPSNWLLLRLKLRKSQLFANTWEMLQRVVIWEIFNLNDNQLEGLLPLSLVNCWHLEVFDNKNDHVNNIFLYWLEIIHKL